MMVIEQKFSIREALKVGFNAFVDNIVLLIQLLVGIFGIGFTCILIAVITEIILIPTLLISTFALIVGNIILAIALYSLYLVMKIGLTGIYLDIIDGKKVTFSTLFARKHLIGKAFVVSWLYALMVAIGHMFFIVPGIILAIVYYFALYEVIDRDCGIIEAFSRSRQITHGVRWKLLCYGLINWAVSSSPLFIFKSIISLGETYIYRQLDKRELRMFMNTSFFN
jgi:uncharacterized membrane protein